ncbi:hypothetical protein [Candidatus Poriferisocius sp.]|uniref:hypothetical protein n=1 Tax=Candidatus Poriferisocius sp. TaxID=3101276 RepID=UPI003B018CEE
MNDTTIYLSLMNGPPIKGWKSVGQARAYCRGEIDPDAPETAPLGNRKPAVIEEFRGDSRVAIHSVSEDGPSWHIEEKA